MATYAIDLPDHLVPGLQLAVQRYNANNGTDLTVLDWLAIHIAEIAVSDRLAAETTALQAQAERDFQSAVAALRDRLVKGAPDAPAP